MSTPAQAGVFSLALQADKIGEGNTFNANTHQWYRTRAPRIGVGTTQIQDVFPPETGGPIVDTGAFKSGQYVEGDLELIPRMQEILGLIFYGALGAMETRTSHKWNPNTDAFVAYTGVNAHRITMDPVSSYFLPWLALRTVTPGVTPDKNFGQLMRDCKVAGIELTVPASGLLGMTVSFMGRKGTYPPVSEVNGWTYSNSTEDAQSAAHAGRGSFQIGGVTHPITQASISLQNGLTSPQQEMIVSSYHPDNFIPLKRSAQIRIVYKWQNADFYRKVLTGSVSEADWQSIPYEEITSGATKAFKGVFQSPANIPGSSPATPYEMMIIADKVVWSLDRGGISLQGADIIQVPYVGTVLEPNPGGEWLQVIFHNAAEYTIPVVAGAAKPIITIPATANYSGSALAFAPAGTVTDSDSANFNTGSLLVEFLGDDFDPTDDKLQLGAGASFSGTNVLVGATVVGTVSAVPGAGNNLYITFNASATPSNVTTLLQAIQYHTVGAASRAGDEVTLRLTMMDGDGGTSIPRSIVITHQ